MAYDRAKKNAGEFLLRIEDIDQARSRSTWEQQIFDDLEWLGLSWPKPVLRQSDRQRSYQKTLDFLWSRDLLFACTCTRADISAAAGAPQEGTALIGPDGVVYPGTCRPNAAQLARQTIPKTAALRLDMAKATMAQNTGVYSFVETGSGPNGECGRIEFAAREMVQTIGDIVLARRDMGTSYHLSVVLDDAFQGVTHITRGQDLFEATKIHVVLQKLLGLPTPVYHHHRLIRDESGKRLAKRDDAQAISKYRAEGASPADIRRMVEL